ncbi:MAG: SH3 domain-containing protein [Butyrivibrio sp.]|nr:SH3 domain-containing protein [Acetatifactor muris]MCM1559454.1 SH3 domain-containing protein [Butyrivibrio sp.]
MHKDKWKTIRDIIIGNCKIVFPVLVVILGAITAVIALNANKAEAQTQAEGQPSTREGSSSAGTAVDSGEVQPEESRPSAEDVPLVANEDEAVYNLVAAYYNAIGAGDSDALQTICRGISENNVLYYSELAKYVEGYSDIEIYSKQGPEERTVIAYVYYKMNLTEHGAFPGYEALYVCTDEDGSLYIKDSSTFTEEEKEYIVDANGQVDVVEFNNRVIAEYNELLEQNPALLEYVGMLSVEINTRVGETLSSRIQENESQEPEGGGSAAGGQEQPPAEQVPAETGPQYASATTTVNVRNSDSEQADKLGKVSGGTRLEVQEVRLNGWTKVVYEGKDGYIKSDYLQFEESAANLEVIGSVTATTNINIRAAASENAERLGMLAGGASLPLLGNENGWCKVNYNGQVAYVKADYVTQQ